MQNLIIQKTPEIGYKKKKKKGEWITATKQHVDVLAEVQHRRSKKPQQHWGTSWMCFHLELGLSWQLSSSNVLSRKVLTIYTGRGFSKRKGTSFIEVERYHMMTVSV